MYDPIILSSSLIIEIVIEIAARYINQITAEKDHGHFNHDYRQLYHSLDMINVTDNGACLCPAPFRSKYFSCLVKVLKTHLYAG